MDEEQKSINITAEQMERIRTTHRAHAKLCRLLGTALGQESPDAIAQSIAAVILLDVLVMIDGNSDDFEYSTMLLTKGMGRLEGIDATATKH